MAMQNDITDDRTDREIMEDIYETLNETSTEVKSLSRALQVKGSLVNANPTVDRVLEACHNISWYTRQAIEGQKEHGNEAA